MYLLLLFVACHVPKTGEECKEYSHWDAYTMCLACTAKCTSVRIFVNNLFAICNRDWIKGKNESSACVKEEIITKMVLASKW